MRQRHRGIAAGIIGTTVEWFDFTIYASFAVIIGDQFFPSDNANVSVLAALATFGVAFFVRPLGGIVFGHMGDRVGRRSALARSVLLMSAATMVVGFLPGHATIGVWAPILLVASRCVQGFAVGGELSGAMTYVVESGPRNKQGWWSSFVTASTVLGVVLATLVALLINTSLTDDQVGSWGWRIPFLLAGPLGVVGLYLRLRLTETPAFTKAVEDDEVSDAPLVQVVRTRMRSLGLVFAWIVTQSVAFYFLIGFFVNFMTTSLDVSRDAALATNLLASILFGLSCPLWGRLADSRGRRPVLIGGLASLVLLTVPIFAIMSTGNMAALLVGQAVFGVAVGAVAVPVNVMMIELFPVDLRYSGSSLAYNAAQMVFGGTAAFVAAALTNGTGLAVAPGVYLTVLALASLVVTLLGLKPGQASIDRLAETGRDAGPADPPNLPHQAAERRIDQPTV